MGIRIIVSAAILALPAAETAAVPPGQAHVYKQVGGRDLKLYITSPSKAQSGWLVPHGAWA